MAKQPAEDKKGENKDTQNAQPQRKTQDEEDVLPLIQLNKAQVLHGAKAFNETPLDTRKCCSVLTELLCLLSQGEKLIPEEATTVFFGVTKLFQSQNAQLRRLVYLVIKELNQNQDEAFIVISSLEKDINGSVELFRANALRVHSKVIDASMLEQRARLFRQAIVNPNEHIASAALTAGIRMFPSNPEVIRRWVNEVRETTKSSKKMVSYHGLHLLYKIHQHDKTAILRLVQTMIQNPSESQFTRCLLIRYVYSISGGSEPPKMLLDYLKDSIKQYKSPMVMFEAAKALCHLPHTTESDLVVAMNVLQEFLNSQRVVQRFASVRALSQIVSRFPNILTAQVTVDLERLITDSNRNIATLAITTLLKTAPEYSIERLLNSISTFMAEIPDELKIVLIDAIRSVCEKFPKKYESILQFLGFAIREEAGYEYKNKIIDCMLLLINHSDRAKEYGLDNLCEFIEDCEYPELSVRILHLISQLGPKTTQCSRYIRFVFNRILLECACVRAAAISCLARCAVQCPQLKNDIHILLKRSLVDQDDEARDRATIFSSLLDEIDKETEKNHSLTGNNIAINNNEEKNNNDDNTMNMNESVQDNDNQMNNNNNINNTSNNCPIPKEINDFIDVPAFDFNIRDLESALSNYVNANENLQANNKNAYSETFNVSDIVNLDELNKNMANNKIAIANGTDKDLLNIDKDNIAIDGSKLSGRAIVEPIVSSKDIYSIEEKDSQQIEYEKFLSTHSKDIPNLGNEMLRTKPVSLTEPEAEYQVEVMKHVYEKYIVLQYNIQSSMEGSLLNDVYVNVLFDDWIEAINISCDKLKIHETGVAITIVTRNPAKPFIIGNYHATLMFTMKDDNNNADVEEGYQDEYILTEISFTHHDYILDDYNYNTNSRKNNFKISDEEFREKWEQNKGNPKRDNNGNIIVNDSGEPVRETGNKQEELKNIKSLQDAAMHILKSLKFTPLKEIHINDNIESFTFNAFGRTIKNDLYLFRCVIMQNKNVISYKAQVRPYSRDDVIAQSIINQSL